MAIVFAVIFVIGQVAIPHMDVSAAVKGKRLNVKKVTLTVGQTKQLKVFGVGRNKVTWSSSKNSVVTVSKKGKIKAKKPGKSVITAKFPGGKLKCSVTVKAKKTAKKPSSTKKPAVTPIQKPTVTATPKVTKTPTQEPTVTATPKATEVPTQEPIVTAMPEETVTPAQKPTVTATPEITKAPTQEPTVTATPEITEAPTQEPTVTATPEITEAPTQEPTVTPTPQENKILVAYFSWSGTSERIAKNIIEQTGADSFQIEREVPYSSDYQTTAGEAKEEADTNARPAIKDPLESIAQYDKIIICYPIWWHTAPMTVGTFLESYDFTGKTIYPVSQSASMDKSQYAQSVAFIKECAKGATVEEGIFSRDNTAIQDYIKTIQEME